jgi:CubicO group peptidase (beta-lactamase class C family)
MFLIQDKKITSENDLVSKYIHSWNYGKKKDITIKHLLTHTSGLDNFWNYDTFMWPNGNYDDYIKGKLSTPNARNISLVVDKDKKIDEAWRYNDVATQVIPTLVKEITNKDINRYLYRKLFKPLGITYKWNHDDYGNSYGPNGFMTNSLDLCKIGLFILNDGKYNNKQILQKSFIDKMIYPHIQSNKITKDKMWEHSDMTGYGYMWWRYNDLIISLGYLGQILVIDKKNKLVGCRLIESKWDNQEFVKETEKDTIYFNQFKEQIMDLSNKHKTKKIKAKGLLRKKTLKYSLYRPTY